MLRGEVEYWKVVVKISERVGDSLGLGGILRGYYMSHMSIYLSLYASHNFSTVSLSNVMIDLFEDRRLQI
jgi:hypothetical protein